jgi:hypothetical protein
MKVTSAIVKDTSGSDGTKTGRAVEDVVEKLVSILYADIAHGHFEIKITGTDAKAGFTEVVISAGKKFRFVVPKQS